MVVSSGMVTSIGFPGAARSQLVTGAVMAAVVGEGRGVLVAGVAVGVWLATVLVGGAGVGEAVSAIT